jgi:hypothetical protein
MIWKETTDTCRRGIDESQGRWAEPMMPIRIRSIGELMHAAQIDVGKRFYI